MLGSFIPVSAVLFCLAIASTQAWLFYHRYNRPTYTWIVISLVGFFVAVPLAVTAGCLSIALFRLDVLQNGKHGAIASIAIIMSFGVVMILSQWLILRRRVSAPMLQASLNVVLGTATWLFFVSQLKDTPVGLLSLIVLSIVLGVGLGGIIHKTLNSWIA
ncbi:MAG: hypothetical protein HC780_09895 [Leptolyngbyaceae cyanobacterium CSU_1_3]|nr:hypothetical protein [Leptolyngbyaceae cyanobacterium CSU_1_3]